MPSQPVEKGTEWTAEPIPCGFCGEPDNGYAKKDKDGKWRASCWECIRPKNPPPPMKPRKKVEEPIPEDEPEEKPAKKTKRKK